MKHDPWKTFVPTVINHLRGEKEERKKSKKIKFKMSPGADSRQI